MTTGDLPLAPTENRPGPVVPSSAVASGRTSWFTANPFLVLTIACIICLAPFAGKAYHIDDPLFIWVAQQIQKHPTDCFGFRVNWYFTEQPMFEITKNPPLASYYLALVASSFGYGEVPVHLAFLVWPIGVVWGTYRLAERFCSRPLLASLTTLMTPVFLISSTSVMCDSMMLCFWVWALVYWERGLSHGQWLALCWSGVLIGLCSLTKYFGASLILLLLVHGLMARRSVGLWLLPLLIPVAILAGYQWETRELYGRGLLADAATFATDFKSYANFKLVPTLLIALAFTGGGISSALFFLPRLWSRATLWCALGGAVMLGMMLGSVKQINHGHFQNQDDEVRWLVVWQFAFFLAAGFSVMALTVADMWSHRDAQALLLFLWVMGTCVFTAVFNWVINGRSILPMVPAVAILLMRRIAWRESFGMAARETQLSWPLIPAGVLALLVAWADATQAEAARAAARRVHDQFAGLPGTVWFEGHWGFQYYMQQHGARIVDFAKPLPRADGIVVLPQNNHLVLSVEDPRFRIPKNSIEKQEALELSTCPWLSTMSQDVEAGYYATIEFGLMPYAFGSVGPEVYLVQFLKPGPGDNR